jgi:hypothetical protein
MEEKYVLFWNITSFLTISGKLRMCNANSINAGTVYPERFLIAQDEINGNNFAPSQFWFIR